MNNGSRELGAGNARSDAGRNQAASWAVSRAVRAGAIIFAMALGAFPNSSRADEVFNPLQRMMRNDFSVYNSVDRAAFAQAIQGYCIYVRNLIPTPTPAEAQWLKAEMDSGAMERLQVALRSDIYAASQLVVRYESCANGARFIFKDEQSSQPNLRRWGWLLDTLTQDEGYWVYRQLQKTKQLQDMAFMTQSSESLMISAILRHVIIPSLPER